MEKKTSTTDGGTPQQKAPTVLGKVEKTSGGIYRVKEKAIVGKIYTILCPQCNRSILIKAPAEKTYKISCKACGIPMYYVGKTETEEKGTDSVPTEKYNIAKPNAKLVWGGLLHRKTFCLKSVREYYLGRKDNVEPSDISINDDYASRRSAVIKVIAKSKDCLFQLTVKKAANPVLVNGKTIQVGESTFLNYGDTILLGETTITFKQNKD